MNHADSVDNRQPQLMYQFASHFKETSIQSLEQA
jgi:hypothetical protein